MLTTISAKDEKNIKKFIKLLKRGPFRHLNDKECSAPQSEFIVRASKSEYKNIYQCAVAQAWLDTCRTVEVNENNKAKLRRAREIIADMLKEYFNGKAKDMEAFDSWYDSLLSRVTSNIPLTVGQAQKVINMSFKYLMCCDDIRQTKLTHFTWCHMPLDSVTLEWIGLRGLIWNSIDDSILYSFIQEYVRSKVRKDYVLLKEFEIWEPKNK